MTDLERAHPYGFNGTQEQLLRALRTHPKRESASTYAVKEAAAWEIERLAAARREAIEECVAWLRQPTSDALNRGADNIRGDLDPLQRRVAILLDGIADEITAFLQLNIIDAAIRRVSDD